MMDLQQLRRLERLLARASSAIVPLAADGEGRDGHGGKIRNARKVLLNALIDVRQAAAVAEDLERSLADGEGGNPA